MINGQTVANIGNHTMNASHNSGRATRSDTPEASLEAGSLHYQHDAADDIFLQDEPDTYENHAYHSTL